MSRISSTWHNRTEPKAILFSKQDKFWNLHIGHYFTKQKIKHPLVYSKLQEREILLNTCELTELSSNLQSCILHICTMMMMMMMMPLPVTMETRHQHTASSAYSGTKHVWRVEHTRSGKHDNLNTVSFKIFTRSFLTILSGIERMKF